MSHIQTPPSSSSSSPRSTSSFRLPRMMFTMLTFFTGGLKSTDAAFISTRTTIPSFYSSFPSAQRHHQMPTNNLLSPPPTKTTTVRCKMSSGCKADATNALFSQKKMKKVTYTPTNKDNSDKKDKNVQQNKNNDPNKNLNIVLIDNYDSYTYNLYQYLSTIISTSPESNETVATTTAKLPMVIANNAFSSWKELHAHATQNYFDGEDIDCIVISPGPGRPECEDDLGICLQAIEENPEIPILGVCLGHQALGYYYNASVILSPDGPIHGQLSSVCYNDNNGDEQGKMKKEEEESQCNLFQDIPQNFDVVRYHSLAVQFPTTTLNEKDTELEIEPIAWCDTIPPSNEGKVCMALRHKEYPHYGVQFHPESIGTGENGYKILDNFCDFVVKYWKHRRGRERKKTMTSTMTKKEQSNGDGEQYSFNLTQSSPEELSEAPTSRYHVLIHKLPSASHESPTPEQVYEKFFVNHTNSFWLDSSTGRLPSSTSSPDNQCPIESNSRFSIMGGNDGPLSRRIEYYGEDFDAEQRGLRIVFGPNGEGTVEEEKVDVDILSYLRERIANHDEIVNHAEFVTFEKDSEEKTEKIRLDRLEEFTEQTTESQTSALPFEYRGGYVGYLGYEVRHDTRKYIMEQEQQHGKTTGRSMHGLKSGASDFNDHEEKKKTPEKNDGKFSAKHNENVPTAAFLFADRSILYDHWMNEWYIIGVASNEDYFHQISSDNYEKKGMRGENDGYVNKDDVISWIQEMGADICALSSSLASSSKENRVVNGERGDTKNILPNDESIATTAQKERSIQFTPNRSKSQYQADITRCHEEIKNGESYELCVTNQLEASFCVPWSSKSFSDKPILELEKTPYGLYRILRRRNPAPFAAFLKLYGRREGKESRKERSANVSICCSSPERFLSVTKLSCEMENEAACAKPWYSERDDNSQRYRRNGNDDIVHGNTRPLLPSLRSPTSSSTKRYQVESKPIKGTAARHFMTKQQQPVSPSTPPAANTIATPPTPKCSKKEDLEKKQDEKIANELRESVKNRAENLMIVDLLRNDLSRVCKIGSVHVPRLMYIETFATVHQMVSTIRGTLESNEKENINVIDLISACFPGGSMTGAPKLRTMDILDEMEKGVSRGPYSGSLGYISLNGCMDMNIVIRTAVLTPSQDTMPSGSNDSTKRGRRDDGICWQASIGAGGAITALSESDDEYEEMLLKARAVKNAVRMWVDQISAVQNE